MVVALYGAGGVRRGLEDLEGEIMWGEGGEGGAPPQGLWGPLRQRPEGGRHLLRVPGAPARRLPGLLRHDHGWRRLDGRLRRDAMHTLTHTHTSTHTHKYNILVLSMARIWRC